MTPRSSRTAFCNCTDNFFYMSVSEVSKQTRGAHLLTSLPALQSAISHSPSSYRSEFLSQWSLQLSLLELLSNSNSSSISNQNQKRKEEEKFRELIRFCGNVGHFFDKKSKGKGREKEGEGIDLESWAGRLSKLALEGNLTKDTRKCIVGTLVGIRRRGGWESIE
jgi:protein SDA1